MQIDWDGWLREGCKSGSRLAGVWHPFSFVRIFIKITSNMETCLSLPTTLLPGSSRSGFVASVCNLWNVFLTESNESKKIAQKLSLLWFLEIRAAFTLYNILPVSALLSVFWRYYLDLFACWSTKASSWKTRRNGVDFYKHSILILFDVKANISCQFHDLSELRKYLGSKLVQNYDIQHSESCGFISLYRYLKKPSQFRCIMKVKCIIIQNDLIWSYVRGSSWFFIFKNGLFTKHFHNLFSNIKSLPRIEIYLQGKLKNHSHTVPNCSLPLSLSLSLTHTHAHAQTPKPYPPQILLFFNLSNWRR